MSQSTDDAPIEPATTVPAGQAPGAIVARADGRFRMKHFIMAIALIAGGCWFAYDGWVNWPRQNAEADRWQAALFDAQNAPVKDQAKIEQLASELKSVEKHNDANILLQKILAGVLPVLGIFWAGWTLYDTRGQIRLEDQTLHAPGHPPITIGDIRRIDKRRWDRKGIAYLHYETSSPPASGILKLDDFAYQRQPVDSIFRRIEQALVGPSSQSE